jgi:phosphate-selective porin OprO and OprP
MLKPTTVQDMKQLMKRRLTVGMRKTGYLRKTGLLAALVLFSPVASEAKTLEELLVEKGVITRSEASTTSQGNQAKVYYNEGTRIDFPGEGFTLKVRTMLQGRYTFNDEDEKFAQDESAPAANWNGVNGTRTNTSSFDIVRARIVLEGTALYEEFAYKVEGDFVGTSTENLYFQDLVDSRKEPNLKDAYITWQPCEGYGTQMGQFRTFISRQFRTNDAYLQFADRSIVSDYNYLGWQQGIAQHADLADGLVQVSAGVFNGLSDGEGNNRTGVDTNHTVMGTIRLNPTEKKIDPFVEGDVDYSEDLGVSLGAAYAYSEAHQTLGPVRNRAQDVSYNHVSSDLNLKYSGFSIHGEYFYQGGELQHGNGFDYSSNGGYVQTGFFISPRELELAGRYSYLDCDGGAAPGFCSGKDFVSEASGTINYYFWKHSIKAQLGYSNIHEDFTQAAASGSFKANTNRWTFQLSSYF